MNGPSPRIATGVILASLLVAPPVFAAQKYIVISDSLAANAEQLDVKSGAQWMGQIRKWRFGEYAVAASKNGGTSESTTSNLFKTKVESKSSEVFAFVLTDNAPDSASVSARRNSVVHSSQAMPLGKGWTLGTDQVAQEADSVTAVITIHGDPGETWSLRMRGSGGQNPEGDGGEQLLSDGARRITLVFVSSVKDGDQPRHTPLVSLTVPAFGFEFVEDGRSLGAVQYCGGSSGGPAGMYKYVVWMRRDLDARMKLVLAAAMTTILQLFAA